MRLNTENCLEVELDGDPGLGSRSLTEIFFAKSARYLIFSNLLRFQVFLTVGAKVVVVVVVAVVVVVDVDVVLLGVSSVGLYKVSSRPKSGV